ncbi:DUF6538 domain-containing protein [Pseudomonas poae]|uniref:DUF6538 domain-containing protein n=1 Tax=Pseudomonas poae TaxID=200451 RepID=UPI0030E4BBE9
MATHLVQKPSESTWYVRMAVPADVRLAFGGRAKLIKTTGTSNKAEAMDKRLPILAQWKADIKAARDSKADSGDEWRLAQHTAGLELQAKLSSAVTRIYTPLPPIPLRPIFHGLSVYQRSSPNFAARAKMLLQIDSPNT